MNLQLQLPHFHVLLGLLNKMNKMSRFTSFVCLSLVVKYILQFSQQLVEIFSHIVSADRVNLVEIIGRFPLVNVVFSVGIVKPTVVVEHSSSNLQISEADSSSKSSQIVNYLIALSEKLKDLVGLGVSDVEDFLFGEPGVVGTVGDRSRVVIAVESVEVHRICQ